MCLNFNSFVLDHIVIQHTKNDYTILKNTLNKVPYRSNYLFSEALGTHEKIVLLGKTMTGKRNIINVKSVHILRCAQNGEIFSLHFLNVFLQIESIHLYTNFRTILHGLSEQRNFVFTVSQCTRWPRSYENIPEVVIMYACFFHFITDPHEKEDSSQTYHRLFLYTQHLKMYTISLYYDRGRQHFAYILHLLLILLFYINRSLVNVHRKTYSALETPIHR